MGRLCCEAYCGSLKRNSRDRLLIGASVAISVVNSVTISGIFPLNTYPIIEDSDDCDP